MSSTWAIVLGLAAAAVLGAVKYFTGAAWDVFWSALGAVATTLAVLVALWLPFYQDKQRRRESDEKMRFLYADIFFEVDRSISIFEQAEELSVYTAQHTEDGWYQRRIRDVEERASNSRKVLHHLLTRDGLADGVIRRALDAIDLNKETARAVAKLYEYETHADGGEELRRHHVRRDRILAELEDHRLRVGLDPRAETTEQEVAIVGDDGLAAEPAH